MELKTARSGASPFRSSKQAFAEAAALFLDWDGCVMIGNTIVPAARALLARHSGRIVVLSNDSTHLPEDFSRILAASGIVLAPDRIVLAGAEAVRVAAQWKGARTLLLGSAQLKGHARQMGLKLVRDAPDQILLTRDMRFSYAALSVAINALHRGADLIVANGDLTHPGPGGSLVPETGALLAAILACVPGASIRTVGKPGPLLFSRACEVAGVSPQQAVMIGDNPATDGQGARDYGIFPVLVGPSAELTLDDLLNW